MTKGIPPTSITGTPTLHGPLSLRRSPTCASYLISRLAKNPLGNPGSISIGANPACSDKLDAAKRPLITAPSMVEGQPRRDPIARKMKPGQGSAGVGADRIHIGSDRKDGVRIGHDSTSQELHISRGWKRMPQLAQHRLNELIVAKRARML